MRFIIHSKFQIIFKHKKKMGFHKDADIFFDVLTIISLVVFAVEIIMSWIVKDDYKFSFFFWLDVISTLSLILDI